jgi:hypothetical protein
MDGLGTWQEDCQFMAACAAEQVDPAVVAKAVDDGTAVFLRSRASQSVETFAPTLVDTGTRAKVTALIGLGPRDRDRASIIDSMSVIVAARPDAVIDLTTNPEGIALRHELKEVMGVPLGACLTPGIPPARPPQGRAALHDLRNLLPTRRRQEGPRDARRPHSGPGVTGDLR